MRPHITIGLLRASEGMFLGGLRPGPAARSGRRERLALGLLAAGQQCVPLGAEGGEVVAVGFARLLVRDVGVERCPA